MTRNPGADFGRLPLTHLRLVGKAPAELSPCGSGCFRLGLHQNLEYYASLMRSMLNTDIKYLRKVSSSRRCRYSIQFILIIESYHISHSSDVRASDFDVIAQLISDKFRFLKCALNVAADMVCWSLTHS